MKKLFYSFAALAAMVLVAGCAREFSPAEVTGDTVTATFTVTAPGIATKTISDGSGATDFTFAVYDQDGHYLQALSEAAEKTGSNPQWKVTVPVVKDLTYQFAFIAKAANSPYAVDLANKTVTATYGNANDDAADFFYATLTETIGNDLAKSVDLVRPLAQVNVGAADLVAAGYSLDVANMTTGLKLTGINKVLNILDGTVSDAEDITLAEATRVTEESAFVTGYDRIAMGYVLVGDKQTSDATINITAQGKVDGVDHAITREVANIPLQANYRTNILGNIFTGNMTFTVNVVPGFDTPDINETLETNIEKANTLFAAGQTSVTVDLAPGESGETTVTLPATTEEVRLNLNITTDKTITVQYAEGDKPAKVEIYAKDVNALVADLTSTTVTITAGSHIHTGTFKTAATTLIIEATAKVDNLVVNAGTTKIYGEVGTISGEAAADAAFCIATVKDLEAFRDAVNGGTTYNGFTVILENDIDLSSVANWTPIGIAEVIEGASPHKKTFEGTFDGNDHKIENLTCTSTEDTPLGLFAVTYGGPVVIKNLTLTNVHISGVHQVGGIIGNSNNVTFENCTVDGGSVITVPRSTADGYDDGNQAGGIAGLVFSGDWHASSKITGCTIKNLTVKAYRDVGGIAGACQQSPDGSPVTIEGNTVENSTIIADQSHEYKEVKDFNANEIVGRYISGTVQNNTANNVTVTKVLAEGITVNAEGQYVILSKTGLESFRDLVNAANGAAIYDGKTFILDTDIDLNNEEWTPIGFKADSRSFVGTFDGNNHTISNLYVNVSGAISGGLFGADDGCTIKNLVIDGAEVHTLTSHAASGCGVVLGANQNVATTIENVTVKNAKVYGNRRVSAIAGYFKGTITGCTVEDVEIVASVDELSGSGKYDNGDKTGGVLGYANGDCTITNNTVSNFSITGYRHIGGLAGYIANSANVKNNTVKNGTLVAFSEHVDVDNHTIGDGTAEIIGKGSTPDETNTYENIRMIINGEETLNCSISDDYKIYKDGGAQLSAEEFEDMSGKIIYEKDGKLILSPKSVAQLTAAAAEGASLTLYMVKGDSYIISTGRSSGVVTVSVIGISDYDGNKMASVQMDNAANGETHSYSSSYLDLTVKNLVLVGEDTDANGDARHGAGFCYANSLLIEDCVFTKSQCLWNQNGHTYTVKNSTFDCAGIGNKYAMWTRGSNSTWIFENCVFNTDGKALKLYNTTGTVNVTGCTFNKVGSDADKNCVEVDCTAAITVSGCTNNGHKGLVDTSKTNVTVN